MFIIIFCQIFCDNIVSKSVSFTLAPIHISINSIIKTVINLHESGLLMYHDKKTYINPIHNIIIVMSLSSKNHAAPYRFVLDFHIFDISRTSIGSGFFAFLCPCKNRFGYITSHKLFLLFA